MSKLTRISQKLFGGTAGSNQIAQFGSLAAGSPQFTTNPATVQALSQFSDGWFNAVISGNSPAIEDMNALHFLYSYQLGYLLQQGIAEYDAGTTYYKYSIVQYTSGILYQATSDVPVGTAPTNTAYWQPLQGKITNTPEQFGAVGDGTTDDTAAFQAAINAGGILVLRGVTYKIAGNLLAVNGAITLIGQASAGNGTVGGTAIKYTSATGSLFASANPATTTYPWITFQNLLIDSSGATGNTNPIIDLTSISFSRITNVLFFGSGVTNGIAIRLNVNSSQSSYYNIIEHVYVGSHYYGVYVDNAANSNTIKECRFQPISGGTGLYINSANNTRVLNNAFEFPGTVSNGIHCAAACDSAYISGNRFESMLTAITIDSGATNTWLGGNYYSSNTTKVSDAGTGTVNVDASFSLTGKSITLPTSGFITASTANAASSGYLRMANNEVGLSWRNLANTGNVTLTVNTNNSFVFSSGISVIGNVGMIGGSIQGASTVQSVTANISSAGFIRMGTTDSVAWRNNANSGNVILAKDTSDNLSYGGSAFISSAGVILTAALSDTVITSKLLTGFSAGSGTVATTDSILSGFNKVVGNIANKIDTALIGVSNGVAPLDSGNKIPLSYLPASLMEYQGTWNASTNTPTLTDGTGTSGYFYRASVAGTQNLGSGAQTFAVGDWVMYNGSIWQLAHSGADTITSVFGRAGVVVAVSGDYSVAQVTGAAPLASPTFTGTIATPISASRLIQTDVSGNLTANSVASVLPAFTDQANTFTQNQIINVASPSGNLFDVQGASVSFLKVSSAGRLTTNQTATGAGNSTQVTGVRIQLGRTITANTTDTGQTNMIKMASFSLDTGGFDYINTDSVGMIGLDLPSLSILNGGTYTGNWIQAYYSFDVAVVSGYKINQFVGTMTNGTNQAAFADNLAFSGSWLFNFTSTRASTFAGNITAPTFIGALTGNASTATSATSFSGTLSGDVTGSQAATAIAATVVTGKVLTGYTSGAGTVTSTDTILQAIQKLNGNDGLKANGSNAVLTGTLTSRAYRLDPTEGTNSYATTVAFDFSAGTTQSLTLTGSVTTITFSNTVAGGAYLIKLVQDGTGSRTAAGWPVAVKWAGGTAPTLTTTASKTDLISLYYDGTSYYGSFSGNY